MIPKNAVFQYEVDNDKYYAIHPTWMHNKLVYGYMVKHSSYHCWFYLMTVTNKMEPVYGFLWRNDQKLFNDLDLCYRLQYKGVFSEIETE